MGTEECTEIDSAITRILAEVVNAGILQKDKTKRGVIMETHWDFLRITLRNGPPASAQTYEIILKNGERP